MSKSDSFWNWLKRVPWVSGGVVLIGVATAAYVVWVSGTRNLTQLELALFQIIQVGLGLVGAFYVGKSSARVAAADVVKPHARSAFRRLVSLYEGLGRLQKSIEERAVVLESASTEDELVLMVHVRSQLEVLMAQIVEQIGTANDAMDDWRDLVPDEVEKLEEAAQQREAARQGEARQLR